MKKQLAELLLVKFKSDVVDMYTDFYEVMRNDLDLDEEEYKNHFVQLGLTLFKIDQCETIGALEWLHSKGELDLIGEHFSDFVYNSVLSMEK